VSDTTAAVDRSNQASRQWWIAFGLLALGLAAVAVGLLPRQDAVDQVSRTVPLLAFLGSVIVFAELLDRAEVFDVVATRMTIIGGGRYPLLFVLCVAFASVSTIFLNLDTTAVLLTPVMLTVAGRTGMAGLPLAMTTVWFANIASLLLPVSNLTNLLAADRVGLSARAFAERMALTQLVAILVGAGCLWVCYWRRRYRERDRYDVPQPVVPADRLLFAIAAVAAFGFAVAVPAGVPLAISAVTAMALLLLAFGLRQRSALVPSLIPARLLVLVVGLFLVIGAVDRLGLGELLRHLIGTGDDDADVARAAAVGALLSNLVNNLPAYVAGEAAVPVADHTQLLGLLIGSNLGSLVVPWASLATLIWFERVRSAGLAVPLRRFAVTGAITATLTLTAATATLIATR
jgi:arsenical pump membrane protein